jgi:homoserine dehydrogenase
MTKTLKVGLLGCGTVGLAVAETLLTNKLPQLSLQKILVKDLTKERPGIPKHLFTSDANVVLADPEISLVIEVLGGEEPALTYALQALENNKHFVTANKELMAKHGPRIFQKANQKKLQVRLDATVGGGIPIINTLLDSLKANHITEVVGILNGTTNYILSEMKGGKEFDEALSEAQANGYAEPDPSNDLDGIDAKYKIAILASLAFHRYVAPNQVSCQGIRSISSADFHFARELGFYIKLLGTALRNQDEEISVEVFPSLVSQKQALAKIEGVLNAIQIRGDLINELLLVGPGAGPKATSSAILGDAISIAKQNLTESPLPYVIQENSLSTSKLTRFYVRLRVRDEIGVIRDLGNVLANNEVSLQSITQKAHSSKNSWEEKNEATLILLTHLVKEKHFNDALQEIKKLKQIIDVCCILKVFE